MGKTAEYGYDNNRFLQKLKLSFPCFKTGLLMLITMCAISNTLAQYYLNPIREVYIDEGVFPTTVKSNVSLQESVNKGFRAFIINSQSEITPEDAVFLKKYLAENNDGFLAFIINSRANNFTLLKNACTNYLIELKPDLVPAISELIRQRKKVLFFENNSKSPMFINSWITYVKLKNGYINNTNGLFVKNSPASWFTYFEFDTAFHIASPIPDSAITDLRNAMHFYLNTTGKFPNFILTKQPELIDSFAKTLPLTVKLETLDNQHQPVQNVRWRGMPGLTTYGIAHLSSAVIKFNNNTQRYFGKLNAQPVKEGYAFIPQLFTFNHNTYKHFKQYKSNKLEIRQDLLFYLPLINDDFSDNLELLDKDLAFNQDSLGNYAHFNGKSNNLYFKVQQFVDTIGTITISFWVKPHANEENHAILSSNDNYVVKIRKGHICITIPGVEDIVSTQVNIEKNKWQHITIALANGEWVKFYKNGILVETKPIRYFTLKPNNQFVVGYDQWEEFYIGGLKNLAFWTRALSEEEVDTVFKLGIPHKKSAGYPWLWWLGLFVLIATSLGYYYRRKTKTINTAESQTATTIGKTFAREYVNSIYCFGSFQFFDQDKNDLLQQLSLKKKAFLFVLLYHTIKDGGISPSDLSDIVWPGYDAQSAKNVRSTYLQNIRNVINDNLLAINYTNKTWTVILNDNISFDLKAYFTLKPAIKQLESADPDWAQDTINEYLKIVSGGSLLANIQSDIIDSYKNTVHLEVLDTLEYLLQYEMVLLDEKMKNSIAETLHKFDPLHEEALKVRLSFWAENNKTKASKILEQFTKEWKLCYGEPYEIDTKTKDILSREV